jgi:hypothetical protein
MLSGGQPIWADMGDGLRYGLRWPGLVKDHFGGDAVQLGLLESILGGATVAGGLILSTWGGFRNAAALYLCWRRPRVTLKRTHTTSIKLDRAGAGVR